MLHLRSVWVKGSKSLDIEYTTPLEKCKNNYYQITLHSLYSGPVEHEPVSVPVECEIQDSAYIASVDTDEINFKTKIKTYSQFIAQLLNGQGQGKHRRASQKLGEILTNNHSNIPSVIFNERASDTVLTSRYFNLKLPSQTYIFSNRRRH